MNHTTSVYPKISLNVHFENWTTNQIKLGEEGGERESDCSNPAGNGIDPLCLRKMDESSTETWTPWFCWSSQRRSNHVCVFMVLACCSLAILMGCVLCFCLHFFTPIPILGMDRQPGAILGDQEIQFHACRVIDGSQVYSLGNIFSSP